MKNFKFQLFIIGFLLLPNLVEAASDFASLLGNKNKYEDVVVEKVISTDTIKLVSGEIIKLIGLRAPAVPRPEKIERDSNGFVIEKPISPTDPIEEKAFKFTQELLKGKHVHLEFDVDKNDGSLTTVAYVFLLPKHVFVNAEILRQGYAYLQISPPNTKYEKQLHAAYQEARREKRGLQGE